MDDFDILSSSEYELVGIIQTQDLKIYKSSGVVAVNGEEKRATIISVSKNDPKESLGYLIIWKEKDVYKGDIKIPTNVKNSPLEDRQIVRLIIGNFYDSRIENVKFKISPKAFLKRKLKL